jgi:hypothetical protein
LRQIDGEYRAFAQNAGHYNFAARLFGKSNCLAEAEAGAFSDFLGCVKRLKNSRQVIGRDACARVLHRDGDELSVAFLA